MRSKKATKNKSEFLFRRSPFKKCTETMKTTNHREVDDQNTNPASRKAMIFGTVLLFDSSMSHRQCESRQRLSDCATYPFWDLGLARVARAGEKSHCRVGRAKRHSIAPQMKIVVV
mmetsp:Transcript_22766/g.50731  ORF Transcript_22766/g.50731 Transcript_22766/m.50731 type:complete len:116 (-) Transcript_22766:1357-1704(-)